MVWAILGVIGTAVATAVVAKLVNILFDRTAHLIVVVNVSKSFASPNFEKQVAEWRKAFMGEAWFSEPLGAFEKYRLYFSSAAYIRLVVKNNSRKKLTAFSFSSDDIWGGLLQIGDGDLIELSSQLPISLSELQPQREMTLHILCSRFGAHTVKDIRKSLVFSADELGHVKFKFPAQYYLKRRYEGWATWLALIFMLATAAAPLLYMIVRG